MNTQQAIRATLESSRHILLTYLSDLTDKELFIRPVPKANHIAWQLGHLISAENEMINAIKPAALPELPKGFSDCYTKETCLLNDSAKFHDKQTYIKLYDTQRNATLQALETFKDAEFDLVGPEHMRSYAPTVGSVFLLCNSHDLMHAGQFIVVRRLLDKPVLI